MDISGDEYYTLYAAKFLASFNNDRFLVRKSKKICFEWINCSKLGLDIYKLEIF